ncbi:MAG: flavin reductase family protein [Syntrophothermus sp.]
MAKILRRPGTDLYPVPVVMVSCVDHSGRRNIITLAWVGTVCSEPPMVGISIRRERFSYRMIQETREFVVNIPSEDLAWVTDQCGLVSGKMVDKFREFKLTPVPAAEVRAPLIAECPVNLECRVRQVIPLGSHDLFIGEILAVHAEETVLDAHGRIDLARARPVAYGCSSYWCLRDEIGRHGFSAKKRGSVFDRRSRHREAQEGREQ